MKYYGLAALNLEYYKHNSKKKNQNIFLLLESYIYYLGDISS